VHIGIFVIFGARKMIVISHSAQPEKTFPQYENQNTYKTKEWNAAIPVKIAPRQYGNSK
jgi:hypothetical protein